MYKLQCKNSPSLPGIKFITNDSIHSYSTRRANNLRLPHINRTTTACNSFYTNGISQWNSLNTDIKKSSTLSRFKRLVKKLFINEMCQKCKQT